MKGFVKTFFLIVLCLAAVSCSDLTSPSNYDFANAPLPIPSEGTIRFDIEKKDRLSRTAVPQAFLNGFYYQLTVYKADDVDSKVVTKYQKTLSFTVPAPSWTGASVARLDMYCPLESEILANSEGMLEISSDVCMTGQKSFNLVDGTRVFNFTIDLALSGTTDGSLMLPVKIGSTNIKSCIIVPDSAESFIAEVSDEMIVNSSVAPFSDHTVFYFFEEAASDLTVSNEQLKNAKLIYSDSITVFANTTTDKWIGIDGKEKTVDLGSLLYSTFYVDGTNGDDTYGGSNLKPLKKLSTAIRKCAQAENGGTIYLKSQPGDTEKIVIDKKVKIENISGGSDKLSLPNIEIRDFLSSTLVTLKGVKISKADETGIFVGKNCSLTLDNVEVSGCEKGIYAGNKCSVDLSNNSSVKNCTGYGIMLKSAEGVLKISDTEVDSDKAATSTFDSCDLYYPYGKVVRLNAPCSDVSKNDDILKEAFDAVGDFVNGSVLLLGKTTSTSVTWEIKENGISVTTGTSGNTYTVKPVNGNCNVTIKRDSGASRQFALLSVTASGIWKINNFTFERGSNTTQTDTSLNSDGKGGAVYLKNGTLDLTSCSFANNSAQNGGAVYVESGTVILDACTIGGSSTTANTANECGGGFYLANSSASLTFKSGTISNNKATENGGAVYLAGSSASFEMEKGVVSSNTAVNGGAVYVASGAVAEIKGGRIISNSATTAGGAFYQGGTFKVSGYTYITPGSAPLANDVYLASGKYVEVTGALSPKEYGSSNGSDVDYTALITPSEWKRGLQVLTGTGASGSYSKIKGSESEWLTVSDTNDSDKVKLYTSYKIYVAGTGKANDIGTGKTAANGGLGTKAKPYASIEEAVKACWNEKQAFTVYLSGSLNGSAQTVPAKDTTAKTGLAESILLTGYTGNSSDVINRNLTAVPSSGSGTALTINNTAPVTIKKIKITGGYTNGNGGGINIGSGCTVKLADDVLVQKNTAKLGGGIYNAGTLFMYKNAIVGYSASSIASNYDSSKALTAGGNIAAGSSCRAGGIYNNSGTIYLGYSTSTNKDDNFTGGVSGNYAADQGGGIFMKSGYLYMHKGNVSYNKTYTTGAGVRVSDFAQMTMEGGSIKGNEAVQNAGGLYVGGNESFIMTGGIVEANKAGSNGGAIYSNSGTVWLENSAYIPYGVGSSTGAGMNDVYGDNFSIADLTPPAACTDGTVATVTPSSYADTVKIIYNSAGYTYAPAISIIPESSQTWNVSPSTGNLQKTTVVTSSNYSSFTPIAGTKYNFVIDSDITQTQLDEFLGKVSSRYTGYNTSEIMIGISTLDLSKTNINSFSGKGDISYQIGQNFKTVILSPAMDTNLFAGSQGKNIALIFQKTEKFIVPPSSEYLWSEDGVVYDKEKTRLVKYPAGKTNINWTIPYTTVKTIGKCAFMNSSYLQSLGMQNVTTLQGDAFCQSGLISVTIPSGITTIPAECFLDSESLSTVQFTGNTITTIKYSAFDGCKNLKTISLPTSLTRIEQYAFYGSFTQNTASVEIPSSVNVIGMCAFGGCTKLTLTIRDTSGWSKSDSEEGTYTSVNASTMTSANLISGSLFANWLKKN